MSQTQPFTKLSSFNFQGENLPVSLVETIQVISGVECDVYKFDTDPSKDLGIIRVGPGSKTPLQKVLTGDKTIEGYIQGKGTLTVTKANGEKTVYKVDEDSGQFSTNVDVGEQMQWQAADDSNLVFYEVCSPPYKDGRFQNIELVDELQLVLKPLNAEKQV